MRGYLACLLGFLASDFLLDLVLPGLHGFLFAFFFCGQADFSLASTYKGTCGFIPEREIVRLAAPGCLPCRLFLWFGVCRRWLSYCLAHLGSGFLS